MWSSSFWSLYISGILNHNQEKLRKVYTYGFYRVIIILKRFYNIYMLIRIKYKMLGFGPMGPTKLPLTNSLALSPSQYQSTTTLPSEYATYGAERAMGVGSLGGGFGAGARLQSIYDRMCTGGVRTAYALFVGASHHNFHTSTDLHLLLHPFLRWKSSTCWQSLFFCHQMEGAC